MTDSSKLKFYSGIKTYIGFENYLDILKVSKFRHVFASFRLSCHGLEIETGRHRGIDKVNRVCKFCINCVEDEYHFMLICKVYDDLRRKYMMPKYYLAPNLHKFYILMSSKNEIVIRSVAMYLFYATARRNELIR